MLWMGEKMGDFIRGTDEQGQGHFGAPRGKRTHKGIDIICEQGQPIFACESGTVTKIGYPYNPDDPKKGHLRYVQVTTSDGFDARYFYVDPYLRIGDRVECGDVVGEAQGLVNIYPGITEHFHFEVKKNGQHIDPNQFLASIMVRK